MSLYPKSNKMRSNRKLQMCRPAKKPSGTVVLFNFSNYRVLPAKSSAKNVNILEIRHEMNPRSGKMYL